MVVVLAIIVIVTTIALLGQGSFNRSMVLTDIAYTLAFSVREAQSLGLSSRIFTDSSSVRTSNAGYGVHFSNATPTSYDLFADVNPAETGNIQSVTTCPGHTVGTGPEARPGNCYYDVSRELVRSYALNGGFRIKSFCGTDSGGTLRCSGYLDALDIVYLRPNTQSIISGIRSGTLIPLTSAVIRVASPDGTRERCVNVSKVGRVSVHALGDVECP